MMTHQRLLLVCIALLQWQLAFSLSSLAAVKTSSAWINDNVQVWEPSVKLVGKNNAFRVLIPFSSAGGSGCDVTVEWSDPQEGAEELVALCFEGKGQAGDAVEVLSESLRKFQSLVKMQEDGINTAATTSFKARIVATRGSQGTKCPRWHYDHVPMRYIQALVGPGCDYVVSENGVDRLFLNQADECETDRINKEMVDVTVADVRQGIEGEAVILRGVEGSDRPAVHKSPVLPWWQGRLIMTLDIAL